MFIIDYRLNFTAVPVTGSLENVKANVSNEMPILVHVPNGPIGQQTIIDNTVRNFAAISVNCFYFLF